MVALRCFPPLCLLLERCLVWSLSGYYSVYILHGNQRTFRCPILSFLLTLLHYYINTKNLITMHSALFYYAVGCLQSLGGSANCTAPVTAFAATKMPDDGKELKCQHLPKTFAPGEGATSEVTHPILVRRSSLLVSQLFAASPTVEGRISLISHPATQYIVWIYSLSSLVVSLIDNVGYGLCCVSGPGL